MDVIYLHCEQVVFRCDTALNTFSLCAVTFLKGLALGETLPTYDAET